MFGTLSTKKNAWAIGALACLALLPVDALATERPSLASEQAIELYERIVVVWPQEAQVYFSMGMLLSGLKRYDEAEETIRRGIAVSQTAAPTGYLYLGHLLVEQKAWDRAVQAYRDALAINPSFEPAHWGLAGALE